MSGFLHIINGDIAADLLRRSHLSGTILPWRDALHEGPVPAEASPAELARIRAEFIGRAGWSSEDEALHMLSERDDIVARSSPDEIVLWFEHDLYDQLQLLQVIAACALRPPTRLSLIEVGEFPGIEKFIGLGQLTPSQLASLFDLRRQVTPVMIELAGSAWKAFRAPDPRSFEAFLRQETFVLPFLQDAVLRHLEDFPSVQNGLGRTEQQLLEAARGDRTLKHLFHAGQRAEERAYMGDTIVQWRIRLLAEGRRPLLTGRARRLSFDSRDDAFWEQEVVLTPAGQAVLDGKEDAVRSRGIDRWFGGVHLSGDEAGWRWDRAARRLAAGT